MKKFYSYKHEVCILYIKRDGMKCWNKKAVTCFASQFNVGSFAPNSPLQLGKINEKIYKVFKFLSNTP